VTIEHAVLPIQSFKITSITGGVDVAYGVDPLVSDMIDHGTSGINLTQSNPTNQASVIAGSPNVIRFDTDDFYNDVETQASDRTYEFEIDMTNAIGATARILASSLGSTSGSFQLRSGGTFRLNSDQNTIHNFPTFVMTGGLKELRLVIEGSEARLYIDGMLESTIPTLTGTFTNLDRIGSNAQSLNSDLKSFKVFDSAVNP
jgi:hypothetical protein